MGENFYQLYIWQGINTQNIQGAQKLNTQKLRTQWRNEQMNWTKLVQIKKSK
jgi:hypothetical protein